MNELKLNRRYHIYANKRVKFATVYVGFIEIPGIDFYHYTRSTVIMEFNCHALHLHIIIEIICDCCGSTVSELGHQQAMPRAT